MDIRPERIPDSMIKNDEWIINKARNHDMINPFAKKQVRKNVVSFGVSSYGYDVRIADEFHILSSQANSGSSEIVIDPKSFSKDLFSVTKGDSCILPPHSYLLGSTVEYFKIPQRVLCICTGKSTYARCGIIANITPLEPEWEGYITMSIINTSPNPVRIYANEGIAQIIFIESTEAPNTSYKDKGGKYQAQKGITLPKIDR